MNNNNSYNYPDVINMNELSNHSLLNYSNLEVIYSNYFTNIPFKTINSICSTETNAITHNYAIKHMTNVNNFIRYMNEIIKRDFKLDNFEIIINTEMANGLNFNQYINKIFRNRNLEHITMFEIMNKSTGFYVRPTMNSFDILSNQTQDPSPTPTPTLTPTQGISINDCPVCFATLEHIRTNFFTCRHHICFNCFNNWRTSNREQVTCPLCRANLNN